MTTTETLQSKKDQVFFNLFPDVVHVTGQSSNGALYLLVEARVIQLGMLADSVLRMSKQHCSVEETARLLGAPIDSVLGLFKYFREIGAGFFSDSPYFIETVRQPDVLSDMILFAKPPRVERLKINLSSQCRNNCPFCSNDRPNRTLIPCFGCTKQGTIESHCLSADWICKALEEARLLDCERVVFSAGDYSPIRQIVCEAVHIAQAKGFRFIECFSGSAMSEHLLRTLAAKDVAVTFQMFSADSSIHDKAIGRPGAFSDVMENISVLKGMGASFNIYYVYIDSGDDPRLSIEKFLGYGPANIYYNRSLDAKDPSSAHLYGKSLLIPPRLEGYANWLSKARCLNSVLNLSANGNYHFCDGKMHQSCGHVCEKTLQQVFADIESDNSLWTPAVEKELCVGCEFNAACHICKARDLHIGPADAYCGYDPNAGCW